MIIKRQKEENCLFIYEKFIKRGAEMKQKEDQRVALTKRLLQEGLLRLLKQKDIYRINVTELCRESGINRATFYKHYTSPHDVLMDIGNSIARDFLDTQGLEESECFPDHKAFLEALCRYLYLNADKMKVLIRYNMDSEVSNIFHNLPQIRDMLTKYLGKRFDDGDVELVITFICSGGYHLVREWLMEDISKTPEEIAALILKLATSGWDRSA